MRIKLDIYPGLQMLKGNFNDYTIGTNIIDNLVERRTINSFLKKHQAAFLSNIIFISRHFDIALGKAVTKLTKTYTQESATLNPLLKHTTGVVITEKMVNYFHFDLTTYLGTTVCFTYDELSHAVFNKPMGSIGDPQLVFGDRDRLIHSFAVLHPSHAGDNDMFTDFCGQMVVASFDSMLMTTVFRSFADHEIKILAKNETKDLFNCVYNNKTGFPVKVMDSTWFTTTFSDGFGVSGHWRFQPCGPNRSQRKLITIDPYEKTGYTRKAQMLKE